MQQSPPTPQRKNGLLGVLQNLLKFKGKKTPERETPEGNQRLKTKRSVSSTQSSPAPRRAAKRNFSTPAAESPMAPVAEDRPAPNLYLPTEPTSSLSDNFKLDLDFSAGAKGDSNDDDGDGFGDMLGMAGVPKPAADNESDKENKVVLTEAERREIQQAVHGSTVEEKEEVFEAVETFADQTGYQDLVDQIRGLVNQSSFLMDDNDESAAANRPVLSTLDPAAATSQLQEQTRSSPVEKPETESIKQSEPSADQQAMAATTTTTTTTADSTTMAAATQEKSVEHNVDNAPAPKVKLEKASKEPIADVTLDEGDALEGNVSEEPVVNKTPQLEESKAEGKDKVAEPVESVKEPVGKTESVEEGPKPVKQEKPVDQVEPEPVEKPSTTEIDATGPPLEKSEPVAKESDELELAEPDAHQSGPVEESTTDTTDMTAEAPKQLAGDTSAETKHDDDEQLPELESIPVDAKDGESTKEPNSPVEDTEIKQEPVTDKSMSDETDPVEKPAVNDEPAESEATKESKHTTATEVPESNDDEPAESEATKESKHTTAPTEVPGSNDDATGQTEETNDLEAEPKGTEHEAQNTENTNEPGDVPESVDQNTKVEPSDATITTEPATDDPTMLSSTAMETDEKQEPATTLHEADDKITALTGDLAPASEKDEEPELDSQGLEEPPVPASAAAAFETETNKGGDEDADNSDTVPGDVTTTTPTTHGTQAEMESGDETSKDLDSGGVEDTGSKSDKVEAAEDKPAAENGTTTEGKVPETVSDQVEDNELDQSNDVGKEEPADTELKEMDVKSEPVESESKEEPVSVEDENPVDEEHELNSSSKDVKEPETAPESEVGVGSAADATKEIGQEASTDESKVEEESKEVKEEESKDTGGKPVAEPKAEEEEPEVVPKVEASKTEEAESTAEASKTEEEDSTTEVSKTEEEDSTAEAPKDKESTVVESKVEDEESTAETSKEIENDLKEAAPVEVSKELEDGKEESTTTKEPKAESATVESKDESKVEQSKELEDKEAVEPRLEQTKEIKQEPPAEPSENAEPTTTTKSIDVGTSTSTAKTANSVPSPPTSKSQKVESESESEQESDSDSDNEAPPIYIYTSLASPIRSMTSRTKRLGTLLDTWEIEYTLLDLGTHERAKRIWKLRGKGRQLPAVVRDDEVVGNFDEVMQLEEDGEDLKEVICEDEIM